MHVGTASAQCERCHGAHVSTKQSAADKLASKAVELAQLLAKQLPEDNVVDIPVNRAITVAIAETIAAAVQLCQKFGLDKKALDALVRLKVMQK